MEKIKFLSWDWVMFFIGLILLSCASQGQLSGGKPDKEPPILDTLKSTKTRQVNFYPKELIFFFDEYVEIKDPLKQILVSPPLTYIPQVISRGRKVSFKFDKKEVLKPDVTYTINFGEAIVDFHEGNKLTNFTYVFSTGEFLDSLNIKGRIVDAKTLKGESDMIILLHNELGDSVLSTTRPMFYAKPDKEGFFEFQNIKADTFQIFALKDENKNYLYDLESEKIAFHEDKIILDTSYNTFITLISSLPITDLKRKTTEARNYGKATFVFNQVVPDTMSYVLSDSNIINYSEIVSDSLNLYYSTELDSFFVYLLQDTIKIKPRGKDDLIKKQKLQSQQKNTKINLRNFDSLKISFNFPLLEIDRNKILLSDTIGFIDDFSIYHSNNSRDINIKYNWTSGEKYYIDILPLAIQSIHGHQNDSIVYEIDVLPKEKLTDVKITILDLDSTKIYKVNVLKNKTFVEYSYNINFAKSDTTILKQLIPTLYDVEIIQDDNNDGVWNPADFTKKRLPEKYFFHKGVALRENRMNEINIVWDVTINSVKKELTNKDPQQR